MQKARTLGRITHKLTDNPFLPMLFIAKVFETAATTFLPFSPLVSFSILAIVSIVVWVLSDSIDVDYDTIVEE